MKESSKKVVAYDNRFNSLKLSVLTKLELNILNFFLYSLKDKEENDVIIPLADIRKYAKIKRTDNQKLIANLTNDKGLIFSLGDKLSRMQIPVSFEEAGIKFNGKFNLFKGYAVSEDEKYFYLSIDPDYKFLVNELCERFTMYSLEDYTKVKSQYSGLMFQILSQWNSIGKYEISVEELKEKLGIPDSYRMCDINTRIIKKIEVELAPFFVNLEVEKKKKGKNIIGYIFSWGKNKEKLNKKIEIEIVGEITEEVKEAVKKCKRNIYISRSKLLTDKNVEKLLGEYGEEKVIKGLKKAYKVINNEITELNYIRKIIQTENE